MNKGALALSWLLVGTIACADTTSTVVEDLAPELPCTPSGFGLSLPELPMRAGPPATTTGSVPHQQIDPEIFPEVILEMEQRLFALPDVERESSAIVAGATGIWLREELHLGRPECVIRGREVGHIHVDGTLHATISHGRIPGAVDAGWVERHPYADLRPGFEAYVLIFSPRDSGEVDVIFDLIVDGVGFVQGG